PQCQEALQSLTANGGTLLAVQVLDRADRAHGLSGKVRLRDSETGQLVDVDLDATGQREYLAAFESERERFESFCRAPRRHYIRVETGENYLQAVCEAMRAKAIVR